jgi:hypothetical protein
MPLAGCAIIGSLMLTVGKWLCIALVQTELMPSQWFLPELIWGWVLVLGDVVSD